MKQKTSKRNLEIVRRNLNSVIVRSFIRERTREARVVQLSSGLFGIAEHGRLGRREKAGYA